MHKSVIGNATAYLKNLLTAVADVPSRSALHDASNGNLFIPRTRIRLGKRAFSVGKGKEGKDRIWVGIFTHLWGEMEK